MAPKAPYALVAVLAWGCTEAEPTPEPEVPALDYCAPVSDWPPELSRFEAETLALVNERRAAGATCGSDELEPAPALTMNPALRCASRIHAVDMGAQDYFSNLDPDKLRYSDRAQMAEYEGTTLGQNIGAAHGTPEQLITTIMGSTGPCKTLMDPSTNEFGMGYALAEGAEYSNYWAQVYGAD